MQNNSLEEVGTSLFHQNLNKRMLLNAQKELKCLLHRLVLVDKISPELADKRDLGEYWERLFQNLQRCYPGEGVTGALLLYSTYLVQVLESSSDVLYAVLRDLREVQKKGASALVLEPRIVVMSHDIPNRLFQQWCYKVFNIPAKQIEDLSQEETTEKIIRDCLTFLYKMGIQLQKAPKSYKNPLDFVQEKYPQLILPQNAVQHLLTCRELLTPQEFLQAYDTPFNFVMDSEIVWPLPELIRLPV
nr:PREDICTED: uncharacterized protein C7orf62 homolog isoform X2 [Latimeria chalumnae]|eukprot:XP_005989352.1 PREDICTED: uncharacterized protein C7orf62 homolog isoform X2 [Latimeria chalumnae]